MSALASLSQQLQGTAVWRWYQGREPGERPVIAGVAGLVLLMLCWSLIWKPVSDWKEVETNRYRNAQSTWDWMQANEAAARALSRESSSGDSPSRSLLPVITRTANSQGLRLNRLQPEADGAVSVVVQAQSFNALLQWLNGLQENNAVSVQRISIDAEGQPGLVNAQMRLF